MEAATRMTVPLKLRPPWRMSKKVQALTVEMNAAPRHAAQPAAAGVAAALTDAAADAAADATGDAAKDVVAAGATEVVAAITSPPADAEQTPALFEAAVRIHSRRLLAIARAIVGNRASAEDIVQQALVNLYQHRERYDWAAPALAGGLLRRAVVNESLRVLRQPRMVMVADDHPDDRGRCGHGASPADPMIDRETIDRVRSAIARLPEHFRAALVLCEYEDMAYAQIAETLGASIPQVKTWLHRGRRRLAEMLSELDDRSTDRGPDARRRRKR